MNGFKVGDPWHDAAFVTDETDNDPINPNHYKRGGLEAISVIEAFVADSYHLGNAVKYILRAGHKDNFEQDIDKAIWYLNRAKEFRAGVAGSVE